MSDIDRQAAIDALNGIVNRFEQILRDIRQSKVDDSVCGMCEYDGAYIGQSGDWCNECPGFEKDDCFKLSDECRKRWMKETKLPPAQSEQHEIGYSECADAMLKMWMDNVLTDGEYSHIMDKLNAHWAERREE